MTATASPVDVSEHIPLIYRVIGQMNLEAHEVDEAFSEGLVWITEAGNKFNPSKGNLTNWLAEYIRWGILSWIEKERNRRNRSVSIEAEEEDYAEGYTYGRHQFSAPLVPFSEFAELNYTIRQAGDILTEEERFVLYSSVLGYLGREIAQHLGRSEPYVSDVKTRAQRKLREMLRPEE